MILYQNSNDLNHSNATLFTTDYHPAAHAPYGGLYKCTGCGLEVGIAQHHRLPPQNHHQHRNGSTIRWRPAVVHN
jgi:hypothetical protein